MIKGQSHNIIHGLNKKKEEDDLFIYVGGNVKLKNSTHHILVVTAVSVQSGP